MGKELEYKFAVPGAERLKEILAAPEIAALTDGAWCEKEMRTTYFDTAARHFSSRHWTLRRRMEGEDSIVCVKTPAAESHTRGEWQVCAETLNERTIEALIAAGAPKELLFLYLQSPLQPVCGAAFTRRSVMLRFSDGSRAELAGDHGILHGGAQTLPFTELELELYEGGAEEMRAFLTLLAKRYGLREEPLSKFARASNLCSK